MAVRNEVIAGTASKWPGKLYCIVAKYKLQFSGSPLHLGLYFSIVMGEWSDSGVLNPDLKGTFSVQPGVVSCTYA